MTVKSALIVLLSALLSLSARGRTTRNQDTVVQKIWMEERDHSEIYPLAQTLLDSVGPRLTGSPEQKRAIEWAKATYTRWGIPVRAEQYGTWMGWHRGTLHVDLMAPRVRSLEGMLMTWSPGTKGAVEGPSIIFPDVKNPAEFEAWLPNVRGKFVLRSFPEPTCRPDDNWKQFAAPGSFERMWKERAEARDRFYSGRRNAGARGTEMTRRLEEAGALGMIVELLSPPWVQGWGVMKMGTATAEKMPELGLSCEDYGLLYRLAENNQGPVLRINSDAQFLGEVPVSNVIAEIKGKEKANECVLFSGHFDSWDAASGATDNGATVVAMMEAMRILKIVYPNPKRTIIAAHWSGEEQGFNGSGAFAADHPDVVNGIQAVFDHDNGTGRVNRISMDGFAGAGAFLQKWLANLPGELTSPISLADPGTRQRGIDASSFTCRGVPAFSFSSVPWDYETYTRHTNRDTLDKVIIDDLRTNAMIFAMLAYLASEEEQRLPRESPGSTTNPQPGGRTDPCAQVVRTWGQRRP